MTGRRLLAPLVILLLLAVATEARITRPRRRGPNLAERWALAVRAIGSVEIEGNMLAPNQEPVRIDGRVGAGAMSLAVGAPSDDPSAWVMLVRMDGREVEVQERATGWILRRRIAEIKAPLSEEGDLFGLLLPVDQPVFHGENSRGEQTWEYEVRGGLRYRVWIADGPLRLLRRDVIRPGAGYQTTFLYDDFHLHKPGLALPRRIRIEENAQTSLMEIRLDRLQSRPPLGDLPPLSTEQRNLFRSGERILADSGYQVLARRVIATAITEAEKNEILAGLDAMEETVGIHPLLDILRARLALATGDTPLAGASIRAASSLGRVIMPLTARVGVMEYLDSGDSALMMKSFRSVLPSQPGGLPAMEERLLVEVTEEISEALFDVGRETEALALLLDAALHAPGNRAIAILRAARLLESRRETEAIRVLDQLVTLRPDDQRCALHLGDLLERLERLDEADSLYQRLARTLPEEPVFPMRRARLLIARQDRVRAEDLLDEVWKSILAAPMSAHRRADLANEIAWMMLEGNLPPAKARRLVDHALSVDPEDPFYMDTLGMIHLKNNQRMAAIMIFERALKRLDHPEIREHLRRARR
jgi:Flp pilus assembly protein TadD